MLVSMGVENYRKPQKSDTVMYILIGANLHNSADLRLGLKECPERSRKKSMSNCSCRYVNSLKPSDAYMRQ